MYPFDNDEDSAEQISEVNMARKRLKCDTCLKLYDLEWPLSYESENILFKHALEHNRNVCPERFLAKSHYFLYDY